VRDRIVMTHGVGIGRDPQIRGDAVTLWLHEFDQLMVSTTVAISATKTRGVSSECGAPIAVLVMAKADCL
jgi:hypothetical protein